MTTPSRETIAKRMRAAGWELWPAAFEGQNRRWAWPRVDAEARLVLEESFPDRYKITEAPSWLPFEDFARLIATLAAAFAPDQGRLGAVSDG